MALRSGYKGFKKLLAPLKIIRPGTLGIDNDVLIPELNKTFFPRSEQAVLGAKNLLKNVATSKIDNGVTYTVNSDGSVSTANTATAVSSLNINTIYLKNGRYILTGCPAGGSNSKYSLALQGTYGGSIVTIAQDFGDGGVIDINADVPDARFFIIVRSGQSADNLVFYPMLRLATDTDPTYAPFAMTNKELTENKVDKGFIQLTSSDDLNNLKENGKRYYWDNATPINYAGDKYCKMFVFTVEDFCHQVIIRSNNQIFMRQFNGTAWQSWYKFEGTVVS